MRRLVHLKDVAMLLNGRAYKQDELLKAGQYPVLRVGNFFSNKEWYYSDLELEEDKYCNNGDLLFAWSASFGPKIWHGGKTIFHYHIWKIVTTDQIEKKYLYYYLENAAEKIKAGGRGITMIHTTKSEMEQMELQLPVMEKQLQIANSLDKISSLVEFRKRQLERLDELVKARFVEMFGDPELNPFGWECLPLSTLVSVEPQNGLYKPQSDYVEEGSGIPILRIDAFYNGKVTDFHSLRRLICSDTERERYLLHENDIVINRVNSIEYLGKCAHIRGMLEDTVFESNMMRFHLNESIIDAGFAVHLLCTQYIYKQILSRAKKAVNQASINQGDVMSFQMLVPPLTLQKQFVTFVEQTDKSKVEIKKSLEQLETLKKAMMQKYFG